MPPVPFRRLGLGLSLIALAFAAGSALPLIAQPNRPPPPPATLKPVVVFTNITDTHLRSLALYGEMFKVISSPRCMNCHPAGRSPEQGDDHHPHRPPVVAGPDGHGPPGLPCSTCHHAVNTPVVGSRLKSVPGNPKWALAPPEMSWEGKTAGAICVQIKDKKRNGGRDLQALYVHMARDSLVGWAWHPGAGRTPAPGTQKAFGELVRAWIDSGADCLIPPP